MPDSVPPGANAAEPRPYAGHRSILASAALLAATTVVVKLAAFAKDWLVARRLGASDDLDAFLVAVLIPSFAVGVLVHAFANGFMPTYIRVCEAQGPAAAKRLAAGVLARACGVLIVVTLALVATAGALIPWLGLGFDGPKLALSESLFYVLAGILIVTGVSAIFAAVLNAHERFAVTAAAPLAVPLATFAALWFLQDRCGVYALAGGTLLGFTLECAVLAGGVRHYRLLGWPRWTAADENLRRVGSQYVPAAMAALLASSSLVIDQSMAASLSSGNVSVLNYGNKIVALVLGIVAVSLSTALFPRFSRLIIDRRWDELNRTINLYASVILFASIPAVALLALACEPLVRFIFERGAFTPQTTLAVSQVQFWYLPQIPFAILTMLGYRVLSGLDGNATVLRIGALNLILNVAGNLFFMRHFGVRGIAMSTSLVFLVAALATLVAIKIKLAEARAHPESDTG